ncbi:MAG: DUF1178 family protein [Caldimonas sp.]
MKVLNLCCGQQHRYEGWFGSEHEFLDQVERRLVACPICGDTAVTRLPSAPHLAVSRHSAGATLPERNGAALPAAPVSTEVTLQSQWLRAMRQVISNTEDVGERFPEEARRIHYGEVEERGIRGRASSEDAAALREEGIEVMALPVPDALKGPVQ